MKKIEMQTTNIQEVSKAVQMQDAEKEQEMTVVTAEASGRVWHVNAVLENGDIRASCSSYPDARYFAGIGLTFKIYSLYEYGAMMKAIKSKEV